MAYGPDKNSDVSERGSSSSVFPFLQPPPRTDRRESTDDGASGWLEVSRTAVSPCGTSPGGMVLTGRTEDRTGSQPFLSNSKDRGTLERGGPSDDSNPRDPRTVSEGREMDVGPLPPSPAYSPE